MRALAVLLLTLAACHKDPTSGRIPIRADEHGFTPAAVTLDKDKPATLVFTRTSDDTCAKEVVFPDIDVKKDLPLNKPVDVDVPTNAPRTLAFSCGMKMFKGSVVVR